MLKSRVAIQEDGELIIEWFGDDGGTAKIIFSADETDGASYAVLEGDRYRTGRGVGWNEVVAHLKAELSELGHTWGT